MRYLLSLLAVVFMTGSAAQAEEARYSFKKMECMGPINEIPKGMADGYQHMGLSVVHFKSKKKDGSFVDSLGWNTVYARTHGELVKKMLKNSGSETWFTGLVKKRKIGGLTYVHRKGYTWSFVGLILKGSNQHRDYVKARFRRPNSTVGDYHYNMNCRAYK